MIGTIRSNSKPVEIGSWCVPSYIAVSTPGDSAMNSAPFYRTLPVADAFIDVTETTRYRPLPSDWHVAVADIVDSTGAIERGKYREVK